MLFSYSFSNSYSFCGFEALHRLADICRPFKAWSGMGVFILTAENAEESAEIAEVLMIAYFNVGLCLIQVCN